MVKEIPVQLCNDLYTMLKCNCLFILLLLFIPLLWGAQFRDGELYLEINLAASPTLSITSERKDEKITVSEMDGLISRSFDSDVYFFIVNPEKTVRYAILDYTEIISEPLDGKNAVVRNFFAWENSHLKIKTELQHFQAESFNTEEEALQYASLYNIPLDKIKEVQLINTTVQIQDAKGNICFMETPLKIHSDTDLYFNSNSYGYNGDFILKTVKKKIVLNQFLPLENYLAGVVQNEIGNNADMEALKAQAVAARTHALNLLLNNKHKVDGYDLCNTTHCQVYKGKYLQDEHILRAVYGCASEVLLINDNLAEATYHSCCGGKTDASSIIWKGKPVDHLNGVICISEAEEYDLTKESDTRRWIDEQLSTEGMSSWERGALSWHKSIPLKQIADNAGLAYINRIEIHKRGNSGRITNMKLIGNETVTYNNEYQIRYIFGNLLSSFFYIEGNYTENNGITVIIPKASVNVKGRGAGHGVGMCQVGALKKAREGDNYHDILQHYYPTTTINKDWMDE